MSSHAFWRLCLGLSLLSWAPAAAQADRLQDLLFDAQKSAELARELTRSILLVHVTLKVPEWADARMAPRGAAFATVVQDPLGFTRLLTSGPIAEEASKLEVVTPDGARHLVVGHRVLGDGALAELLVADLSTDSLVPLPIDEREVVAERVPIFVLDGLGTDHLRLARGEVAQELTGPLQHLLICDLPLHHGAPLITAEGGVLALTFRAHPVDSTMALAIKPETLRAWLRPEGPPYDPAPPADPPR